MIKILKNLKESRLQVVLIILLLCVQATVDLKLPSYTSNIVNVGIQQSGIESAVPKYIRKTQLENLFIFTNESDKNKISSSYENMEKTEANINDAPALESEEVYKLKDLSKSELDELNYIMQKPMMYLGLMNNETISNQVKTMPDEQKQILINTLQDKIDQMGGSLTEQGAIAEVKNEYEAIGIDIEKISNKYILHTGLTMLGIALISMVCAVLIMLLSSRVAAKFGKTMRLKVFNKILSFSNGEFNQFSTASLITRNTNDIQQVQQLLSILFRTVFYAPIMAIGGILMIVKTSNLSMTWIIALAVCLIVVMALILFTVAVPKFKKMQTLIDNLNLVSREILTGIPVIRAFNTQKREEDIVMLI